MTDSLGSTDAVLRNKTFRVSDVFGLAEGLLRNKAFAATDLLVFSDLVNVITGALTKSVSEVVGLSDAAKVLKTLIASDSLTLSDAVAMPSRVFRVLDVAHFTDDAFIDRVLVISDGVSLVEVVQAGVAGARKTKLFLVLGELALQLTGD